MKEYDIAAPSIQCRADKAGAEIFEIDCGCLGVVRVLHFSRKEAEELGKEYACAKLGEFTDETISVEAATLAGLL
jgi:hypothetical protein